MLFKDESIRAYEAPLTRDDKADKDTDKEHESINKQLDLIWKELGYLRTEIRWVIGLSIATLGWMVTHLK